jgi:hypothetical protein
MSSNAHPTCLAVCIVSCTSVKPSPVVRQQLSLLLSPGVCAVTHDEADGMGADQESGDNAHCVGRCWVLNCYLLHPDCCVCTPVQRPTCLLVCTASRTPVKPSPFERQRLSLLLSPGVCAVTHDEAQWNGGGAGVRRQCTLHGPLLVLDFYLLHPDCCVCTPVQCPTCLPVCTASRTPVKPSPFERQQLSLLLSPGVCAVTHDEAQWNGGGAGVRRQCTLCGPLLGLLDCYLLLHGCVLPSVAALLVLVGCQT